MSKYSSFERVPRDLYETIDSRALPPNFLKYITGKGFYEPSCGSGKLIDQMKPYAYCVGASDVVPLGVGVEKDALELSEDDLNNADFIVTNPVYKKDLLLKLIDHWVTLRPTWLLLPSDLMHNAYFVPYMARCSNVVSIGRLFWFKNTWVESELHNRDWMRGLFKEPKAWLEKRLGEHNLMTGESEYTGWWDTNNNKPAEKEFVRSTDNYAFYLFRDHNCETIFETRGD